MFAHVDADTPEEATTLYAGELRVVVEEAAPGAAEAEGLDDAILEAVADSDLDTVSRMHLAEAAAILALADGREADDILADARDELLFAMSSAVTDVERLAASLDTDLDPAELQAKLEGRYPMCLREYAMLRTELIE
jgi:hypothetical protein